MEKVWRRTAYLGFVAAILMTVLLVFAAYGRTQEAAPETRIATEVIPFMIIIFFCTMTLPVLSASAFFMVLRELVIPEGHVMIRSIIGLLINAGSILQLVGVVMVQASSIDSIIFQTELAVLLTEAFFGLGNMMFVLVIFMFAIAMRSMPRVPDWLRRLTFGFALAGFISNPFMREPQIIVAVSVIMIPMWMVLISSLMLINPPLFRQNTIIH